MLPEAEANGAPAAAHIVAISGTGPEAAADEMDLRSGTYIGYAKASNFASSGGVGEDVAKMWWAFGSRANAAS